MHGSQLHPVLAAEPGTAPGGPPTLRAVPLDRPQTPTSPFGQQAESLSLAVRSGSFPELWKSSVDNSVEPVDEALIARLRQAIAVEEDDDETQLNAVLRMLGAKAPDK